MKLFLRIFLAFISALLAMLVSIGLIFWWGYSSSTVRWQQQKQAEIENFAREILLKRTNDLEVPENIPVFVFSTTEELVFSNRGSGRRWQSENKAELIEVRDEGRLIGYYRAGSLQMRNDAANDAFFSSMGRYLWLGVLGSLLISLLLALLLSRNLARPAILLSEGLDRMARGELDQAIPELGAGEMARIARAANRLSRQLDRERELRHQWAQDIAHDLRTPISAIKAQFEAMRDKVLDINPERIERNLAELLRLETLVSNLEELMRLESPEIKTQLENIEGSEFLEMLHQRFEPILNQKNLNWEQSRETIHFRADPALLLRAASNILANALRHADPESTVFTGIESRDGQILLSVINEGAHIPEQELNKVFDRLYRGEYARTTPGSGLGLTIVQRIAALHDGRVWIENIDPRRVAVYFLFKS